jgi:spore coat protein U-like protein
MQYQMKISKIAWILLLTALLTIPMQANAAACSVSDSSAAFGNYDQFSAQPRDTSANIQISCSGSNETVSFDIMANAGGGTLADRRAGNGTSSMRYNLFADISRTQVWGDGTNGTMVIHDSLTITNEPVTRTYTVYGRIPGRQKYVSPGSYSDQLTITLRY